jgi:hypothetical protein
MIKAIKIRYMLYGRWAGYAIITGDPRDCKKALLLLRGILVCLLLHNNIKKRNFFPRFPYIGSTKPCYTFGWS